MTEKKKSLRKSLRVTAAGIGMTLMAAGGISVSFADAQNQSRIIVRRAHQPHTADRVRPAPLRQRVNHKLTLPRMLEVLPKQTHSLASRSNNPLTSASHPWRQFIATWYSGSGGSDGGRITAVGTEVQDDYTVAVDPNVIALGSIIQVKFADGSIRKFHAVDTGGAIQGRRIDIFDSNTIDCRRHGVQPVEVRVITS